MTGHDARAGNSLGGEREFTSRASEALALGRIVHVSEAGGRAFLCRTIVGVRED